jgi:ribosomal protein S18 acetylase RimI-like enzyme
MTVPAYNFIYRLGSWEDREQLKHLGLLAYGRYSGTLTPEDWAMLESILNDENRLKDLIHKSKIHVCVCENEIIGMAYFLPSGNPNDIYKADWSQIRMLGVNPSYKGLGIAKTLTKMCIEYARNTQEKTVALHTSEFMDAARHIYESLGFKILKEIAPRFGKKYWLYTLDLSNS